MSKETLDKSRNPATIHPIMENGAAFKQDGRYYDSDGKRVRTAEDPPDEVEAPKKKVGRPSNADRAAAAAEEEEVDGPTIVGEVNLTAWVDGTEKYRFALVRQAIMERYQKSATDEREARDFLLGEGVGSTPPAA